MTVTKRSARGVLLKALLLWIVLLAATACQEEATAADQPFMPGGDAQRGAQYLEDWGCTACHTIPGIPEANALVGPPLTGWARRVYIAGSLPNTPDNLIRWIQDPQAIEPGTAMPNLGVTEQVARDMGAYLYSLSGNE